MNGHCRVLEATLFAGLSCNNGLCVPIGIQYDCYKCIEGNFLTHQILKSKKKISVNIWTSILVKRSFASIIFL